MESCLERLRLSPPVKDEIAKIGGVIFDNGRRYQDHAFTGD